MLRSLGVALSMQGSGIANVDIASVIIKLMDDGFYTLAIGATDMGTGCDTILTQTLLLMIQDLMHLLLLM